jgi:hypothetical protein
MFADVLEECTASIPRVKEWGRKPAISEWQSDLLIGLIFDPEDGDSMFLKNVGGLYVITSLKIPSEFI